MGIELENHKGGWCWLRGWIFCQEGYCLGCEIYKEDICPRCKANKRVWREVFGEEHNCEVANVSSYENVRQG